MKFCEAHWEAIRAELAKRGLDKFVSPDGPEAMRRMNAAMIEERDKLPKKVENFEPLMQCHNMIVGRSFEFFGPPYMMAHNGDEKINGGHRCPVCVAVTEITGAPHGENPKTTWTAEEVLEEWTVGPVKGMLAFAIENGFILPTNAENDDARPATH